MGLRVNTNISSLQGINSLNKVSRETSESSSKLSSGQRITKAADDAAGLAISEKIKAEVRSSRQANRNANDGISLMQVAEGGLNESSGLLIRMKELAIQAASDTVGDSEREKSNLEYEGLKAELERISRNTEFNGRKLLNGTGGRLDFQVGTGANSADDQVSYIPGAINSGTDSLGVSTLHVSSKTSAQDSITKIEGAISKIASQRAVIGSLQNRLVASSNNLSVYTENMSEANSRIRDVDYASETANQARFRILEDTNSAVLAQANLTGQSALKLV